jgi:His-Xaa-Ser system protein HxsD
MTEPSAAIEVTFAASAFDLEAIKRAAYRFSDRLTVAIEPGDIVTTCTLRLIPGGRRRETLDSLEAHFRNEVLDQDLRMRIRQETEPYRNLILSLAFEKTGLQE